MVAQDPPRIEYPCRYPIKVMGPNDDDFADMVLAIGQRHASEVTERSLTVRTSRNARWVAVTLIITARSESQIEAIFNDLKATGRVTLTL